MIWIAIAALLILPGLEYFVLEKLSITPIVGLLESVITGVIGWRFARREELALWMDLESDIHNRRLPTEEGVDAMLMLLGGWGLMIPGLITDVLGGLLVVPALRQLLIAPIRGMVRDYLL